MPDENPTGDHRRDFELPGWDVERILLRFDGAESLYRVWLNGEEVGIGTGSRLVQEFDVTGLVRPGRNVIMVRVHQWSPGSYLEDQDQWWLPGIFRDITLLGRPRGAVDDVWLRTRYADGRHRLCRPGDRGRRRRVPRDGRDRGARGAPALRRRRRMLAEFSVGPVEPWSAEVPRLYHAQVRSDRGDSPAAAGLPYGPDRR